MTERYSQHDGPIAVAESSTSTRRLLGSEVIRRRVDHLLQSPPVPISSHPTAPHRHSPRTSDRIFLADGHPKSQIELTSPHERKKLPTSAPHPSSLDGAENRVLSPTATSPAASLHVRKHQSSTPMSYTISSESERQSFVSPRRMERPAAKRLSRGDSNVRDEVRRTISTEPVFTGPLAVAEFGRLKQEIETLKETLHEYKKMSRRDKKKLEECEIELNTALAKIQEKDSEISTLKANHKKVEETLSAVEHSIQCQICMELPDKPFALSPCGHTLCLTCLQEWFRKAPPALEDSDIDPEELSDPHYILMRSKSCPSCRARVKRRPVPIFMVKAVTSTLKNAKSAHPHTGNDCDLGRAGEDPWNGIFPSSDEEDSEEHDDDDSELDSDEANEVLLAWYPQDNEGDDDESAGTGSEDEDEHQIYVAARWEPPSAFNPVSRYFSRVGEFSSEVRKLLLRGCTTEMIDTYTLSYEHHSGIVLTLPGRVLDFLESSDEDDSDDEVDDGRINYIFLGWNIRLAPNDRDGQSFVDDTLSSIRDNPAGWRFTQRFGYPRVVEATRLVRVEELEEYDTTDSDTDIWVDAEDSVL